MTVESKPVVMTQAIYARHRRRSRQYISKLAKAGVLGTFVGGSPSPLASPCMGAEVPAAIGACVAHPEFRVAVAVSGAVTIYILAGNGNALYNAIVREMSGARGKRARFPTVPEVQMNCKPVGGPATVPFDKYPGGSRIEQEYLTLTNKNRRIMEIHVREDGPKYGRSYQLA